MDLEEEEEELQGLEWEAEKAYIVATSPRSFMYGSPSSNQPDDDFSWEEDETPSKSTVAVPIICISEDADLSLALDDTNNAKASPKNLTASILATTSLTKAPLPSIMESATESPLLEAKTVNSVVNALPHTNDTPTGTKTNGTATGKHD